MREEDGVNQGLGGTDTYAIFTIRLEVGVIFDVDMDDEAELLGVAGTDVAGVLVIVIDFFWLLGGVWKDVMEFTRLTEGDSSCTYTLRLQGVTAGTGVMVNTGERRARGSGLSWGDCGLTLGGVEGRGGAGFDAFNSWVFWVKKRLKNAGDSSGR